MATENEHPKTNTNDKCFIFFRQKNNWSTLNPVWKKNVRQIVIKISAKKPWGRWWFVTLCIVLYIGGMLKCVCVFSQNLRFFSSFTCETFVKQTNCDGGCVVVVVLFALLFWIGSWVFGQTSYHLIHSGKSSKATVINNVWLNANASQTRLFVLF